jgi:hypothetical protein
MNFMARSVTHCNGTHKMTTAKKTMVMMNATMCSGISTLLLIVVMHSLRWQGPDVISATAALATYVFA